MANKQITEAASQLFTAFEQSTQAIIESMAAVQEGDMQVAQRQFLDWIETLKGHAQAAQSLAVGMDELIQKQQEAFHSLAREAAKSYFDVLAAPLSAYPPSLRLTETLQICLLALTSRYPHHLVDINEAVLGPQRLGAEGWRATDLIEWLQDTSPQLLQAMARLEVTTQRRGIYLLERSEETPAFWLHCGEAGEKMPASQGNMTARQAAQRQKRDEAVGANTAGEVRMPVG
jgi:hypothetical protein